MCMCRCKYTHTCVYLYAHTHTYIKQQALIGPTDEIHTILTSTFFKQVVCY